MATSHDTTSTEPLGGLPEILRVDIRQLRFERPQIYFIGTERHETRRAMELLVRTSGMLPVMDMPPVLFVGDVPINEYSLAGHNHYRFLAFEFQRLVAGAPIALGWPDAPRDKRVSRFRYQPPDDRT